jgi:hypothetical protein
MPDFGDYFDLLAREVGRAGAHTAELRQKIYQHARRVQSLQLQSLNRTADELDIERERNVLEQAIRRIEDLALEQPSIVGTWKMLLTRGGSAVWYDELETRVQFGQKLLKRSRRLRASVLTHIALHKPVDVESAKETLCATWRRLRQWKRRTPDR